MPVNFFEAACQEPPVRHLKFGICDNENGQKAFTNIANPKDWIATVENLQGHTLFFTAIDNCVPLLRENGEMESRCDAILSYGANLVFIELKNQRSGWIGFRKRLLNWKPPSKFLLTPIIQAIICI